MWRGWEGDGGTFTKIAEVGIRSREKHVEEGEFASK